MTAYDTATWGFIGLALVTAAILIPYFHITGKRLDREQQGQHPAE